MNETDAIIDCDKCLKIMKYVSDNNNAYELRKLDGYMRTQNITTTNYHIKNHLEPHELVKSESTGTLHKVKIIRITDKGARALTKTLKKE